MSQIELKDTLNHLNQDEFNTDSDVSIKDKNQIRTKIRNLRQSRKNYKIICIIFSIIIIILSIVIVLLYNTKPQIIYKEKYQKPSLAADNIVIRKHKNDNYHDILLVTRGIQPFQGHLAFPGGFIRYGEDPMNGSLRELKEETDLTGNTIELFTVRGNPERDPRKHVVSIIYLVTVDEDAEPKGGDDAKDAKFYDMKDIFENFQNKMAFDHYEVIKNLVESKFRGIYL